MFLLQIATPWGKVPLLEVDGQTLAESVAICRYLARKFGLTGDNEFQAGKCDEYVDAVMDLRARKFLGNIQNFQKILDFEKKSSFLIDWKSYFWESDEGKKAELKKVFLEGQVPNYFSKFEKILEKSGGDFLLGAKYSWADLFIAHNLAFFEETVDPGVVSGAYPKLRKFKEGVFNIPEIKKWVQERPKTNM